MIWKMISLGLNSPLAPLLPRMPPGTQPFSIHCSNQYSDKNGVPHWYFQTPLPIAMFNHSPTSFANFGCYIAQSCSKCAKPVLHLILMMTLRWVALDHFLDVESDMQRLCSSFPKIRQRVNGRDGLQPRISDLNSGPLNYFMHPKPLWFGLRITRLR